MRDDHAISRRDFLMLSAAAAIALLARSQLPALRALSGGEQMLLATRLAAFFTHKESAKVIGLEYARKYPQEADARVLLDRITTSLNVGDVGLFGAASSNLHGLLVRTMREDFAVDRVVKLQGWVLSVTEARLCALAALM
jgi:hypothetical protein